MGSKAREGAKAMSLAFVLTDFQHAECRHAAVQRGKMMMMMMMMMMMK